MVDVKIRAYDETFEYMDDLSLELTLYKRYAYGKLANPLKCFKHLKNAHDLAFPKDAKVWCQWDHDFFWEHCVGANIMGYRIGYAGGGGVGKSRRAAKLAVLVWLSSPKKNRVLTTSMTLKAASGRVWGYCADLIKEVSQHWDWVNHVYGNLRQSLHWRNNRDDTRSGIYLSATLRGKEENTLSTLIGIHPDEYYLFVIDEANFMPLGLTTVFENAMTGSQGVQVILIANSRSKEDLHGIHCQPVGGWHTVDMIANHRWETAEGVCLHVDPYTSPADTHPESEVRDFYKRINFIDLEQINAKKESLGENSIEFWSQVLGLWYEGNEENTVLTEQMLKSNQAYLKPDWSLVPRTKFAFCDPATAVKGDGCIIYVAEDGYDERGYHIMNILEEIKIIRVVSDEDPYFQVARGIQEEMDKRLIPSYLFGLDAHGTPGLAAILADKWRPDFIRHDGSGSCTEDIVEGYNKPAKDIYENRVTEDWMFIQRLVLKGQIRSMPLEAAEQFKLRKTHKTDAKTAKLALEYKKDFKKRISKIPGLNFRSPDKADTIAGLTAVARLRFNLKPESPAIAAARLKEWEIAPYALAERQRQELQFKQLQQTSLLAQMSNQEHKMRSRKPLTSSYGISTTARKSYREN